MIELFVCVFFTSMLLGFIYAATKPIALAIWVVCCVATIFNIINGVDVTSGYGWWVFLFSMPIGIFGIITGQRIFKHFKK